MHGAGELWRVGGTRHRPAVWHPFIHCAGNITSCKWLIGKGCMHARTHMRTYAPTHPPRTHAYTHAQDAAPLLMSEGGLQKGSWARYQLALGMLNCTGAWGPECAASQLQGVGPRVVELLQGAVDGWVAQYIAQA